MLVTGRLDTLDLTSPGAAYHQYLINDPGKPCGSPCTATLDSSGYTTTRVAGSGITDFALRGVVKDPVGDFSKLTFSVGDNADVMVTDPSGNQTGFDQQAGESVEEIPNYVYWRDSIENQVTGVVDTGVSHTVVIPTPAVGTYQATITGLASGPYTLFIRPISTDGAAQPPTAIQAMAGMGLSKTIQILFSAMPGSASTAVLMDYFPKCA